MSRNLTLIYALAGKKSTGVLVRRQKIKRNQIVSSASPTFGKQNNAGKRRRQKHVGYMFLCSLSLLPPPPTSGPSPSTRLLFLPPSFPLSFPPSLLHSLTDSPNFYSSMRSLFLFHHYYFPYLCSYVSHSLFTASSLPLSIHLSIPVTSQPSTPACYPFPVSPVAPLPPPDSPIHPTPVPPSLSTPHGCAALLQ